VEAVNAAEQRLQEEISSLSLQMTAGFMEMQRLLSHMQPVHPTRSGSMGGVPPARLGLHQMVTRASSSREMGLVQSTTRELSFVPSGGFGNVPSRERERLGDDFVSGAMTITPASHTRSADSADGGLDPEEAFSAGSPRGGHSSKPGVTNWEGWPQNVQLREDLVLSSEEENISKLRNFAVSAVKESNLAASGDLTLEMTSKFCCFLRVVHPAARLHIVFDCLCVLVICLQVFYLPYALVWQDQVENIDRYVLAGTSAFWLVDMFLHFITGFYNSDGEVEMHLALVVRHYLRTWFPADFLCVSTDLLNLASEVVLAEGSNATATRILHIIKLQRFLRALVMLRMLRVAKVLYDYMESQMSAAWIVVLRTLQFAALILWTTHVVACAWYAIGKYSPSGSGEAHWIDTHRAGEFFEYTIAETNAVYQFTSAYHWALAQITLGGLDINPTNTWERVLAIFCLFFGLLFGGVVVSILATTMIGLRELNHDREVKIRKLREFLLQHGTDIGIRLRVVRQVHERIRQQGKIFAERDVAALSVLSTTLRRELRHCLYGHFAVKHPLLHSWTLLQKDSIKFFCNEGVSFMVLLPDDELFATGVAARGAFMLKEGCLTYSQNPAEGFVEEEVSEQLSEGTWISEAAWWCYWFHVGTACAGCPTTIISLPAETVLFTMRRNPVVCAISIEYGIRFHNYVVCAEESPVTDTNVQYVDFNGLFCALPQEVHVILGMAALHHIFTTSQHWKLQRTGNFKLLEEEIREGRSLVLLDQDDVLHRRVALTVLQISKIDSDENNTQLFLTHLATFENESSSWRPDLKLPGVKQGSGEVPHQAFQRLLETRLSQLHGRVSASEWLRSIENQASKQFGIGTQYIKTTVVAKLTDDVEVELAKHALPLLVPAESIFTRRDSKNGTYWGAALGHEDLAEQLSRLDSIYILGGQRRGLYTWMPHVLFRKLETHEHVFSKFIDAIVHRFDTFMTADLMAGQDTGNGVHPPLETVLSSNGEADAQASPQTPEQRARGGAWEIDFTSVPPAVLQDEAAQITFQKCV